MTTKMDRANQSLETLHNHTALWSGGVVPQLINAVSGFTNLSVYAGVFGLFVQTSIIGLYFLQMVGAPKTQSRFGNITYLTYALTTLTLFAATLFVSSGATLALIATAFGISTLRATVLAIWSGIVMLRAENPALKQVYGGRFKQYVLTLFSHGFALAAAWGALMLPAGVAIVSSTPIMLAIAASLLVNLVELYNFLGYDREVKTQSLKVFEGALADKTYFSHEVVYAPNLQYGHQVDAVPKNLLARFREVIERHFHLPKGPIVAVVHSDEVHTTRGRMGRLLNRLDASIGAPALVANQGLAHVPEDAALLADVPGDLDAAASNALRRNIVDAYTSYREHGNCRLFDLHSRVAEEAVLDSAANLVHVELDPPQLLHKVPG